MNPFIHTSNANKLSEPAESLENEEPGVFDEIIETGDQEEVVVDDRFAFAQFGLRSVKVERDVQTLDEF